MNHEMIEQIVQAVKEKALLVNEDSETGFYCITIDKYGIESALATIPEPAINLRDWISVEDRLPDVGVEVMAYTSQRVFEFCYIDAYGKWEGDLRGTKDNPELVTHWQPLPAPPLSYLEAKEGRG